MYNDNGDVCRSVIEEYFSSEGAYWKGDEYWTRNPLRADKNIGSFHISTKGCWIDHAEGQTSGHIVELLMETEGITQKEANFICYGEPDYNSYSKRTLKPVIYDKWFDENYQPLNVRLVRDRNREASKQFYWQYTNDHGTNWLKGKNGIKPTLYNLQKVRDSQVVFFVEGEGNVESVQDICKDSKYSATTSGGVSSWSSNTSQSAVRFLENKTVYIFPDNDLEGEGYARKVLKTLRDSGIKASINNIPGLEDLKIIKNGKQITEKQDIKNWIEAGGSFEELIKICESVTSLETQNYDKKQEDIWLHVKKHTKDLDKFSMVEYVLNNVYDYKYNVVLNQVDIRLKGEESWILIDQRKFLTLWKEINIRLSAGRISQEILEACLIAHSVNDFDPFLEWCNEIKRIEYMDSSESELNIFFSCFDFETQPELELFKFVMKRWLVAVFSLLAGRIDKNEICPVLSGKQGIGKNRFVDKLFESIPRKYIFTGSIQADNKDSRKRIATMALINLDEFDATTRRSDISALKSIITSTEFTDRLPYGKMDITLKRRASFIASINMEESILADETGTRRFPAFRIQNISLDKVMALDTSKLWGEIKYLVEVENEPCFFSKEEQQTIEIGNDRFKKREAFEEYVNQNFRIEKDDIYCHVKYKTSFEIIDSIESKSVVSQLTTDKVGKIMKRLNYTQKRINNVRTWIFYTAIE